MPTGAPSVGVQQLPSPFRNSAGRSVLIDKDGRIIAGNKTVEQASFAGIDEMMVFIECHSEQLAIFNSGEENPHELFNLPKLAHASSGRLTFGSVLS